MARLRGYFLVGYLISTLHGFQIVHHRGHPSAFEQSRNHVHSIRGNGVQRTHGQVSKQKSLRGSPLSNTATDMAGMVSRPIALILGNASRFMIRVTNTVLHEIIVLSTKQKALFLGVFLAGIYAGQRKPFWKRYTDVLDIPRSNFGPNSTPLTGRAVRISDGDTIRFLHTPTPWHPTSLKKGEKVSTAALPIRLCTIDTPETAKFGKKGQPFGKEAKFELGKLLGDGPVKVRLLQKDQYGRAVAQVYTRNKLFKKCYMDEEMLRRGLAEVYLGGGAVYGPQGRDGYLELESAAKTKKLGIWSQKGRESAAEYKKRTK